METNIDPRLQEDESTIGPMEELTKMQMDPNELSYAVKIDKGSKKELTQQLVEFLSLNQYVFSWTHANIVGIHPKVVPSVEHRPTGEASAQKRKALDVDLYNAFRMM